MNGTGTPLAEFCQKCPDLSKSYSVSTIRRNKMSSGLTKVLRAEGCPMCLRTVGNDGASFVVLTCRALRCRHVVHMSCINRSGPTIALLHSTYFMRTVYFQDRTGGFGTQSQRLQTSSNGGEYSYEILMCHIVSNARIVKFKGKNGAFGSTKTGNSCVVFKVDEVSSNSFTLQRGHLLFSCTPSAETSTGETNVHDCVFDLSRAAVSVAPSSKHRKSSSSSSSSSSGEVQSARLVLLDPYTHNVLTLGLFVNGEGKSQSYTLSFVRYEWSSDEPSVLLDVDPITIDNGDDMDTSAIVENLIDPSQSPTRDGVNQSPAVVESEESVRVNGSTTRPPRPPDVTVDTAATTTTSTSAAAINSSSPDRQSSPVKRSVQRNISPRIVVDTHVVSAENYARGSPYSSDLYTPESVSPHSQPSTPKMFNPHMYYQPVSPIHPPPVHNAFPFQQQPVAPPYPMMPQQPQQQQMHAFPPQMFFADQKQMPQRNGSPLLRVNFMNAQMPSTPPPLELQNPYRDHQQPQQALSPPHQRMHNDALYSQQRQHQQQQHRQQQQQQQQQQRQSRGPATPPLSASPNGAKVSELTGKVVEMCHHHDGSRFIQDELMSGDASVVELIKEEMLPQLMNLALDGFGHFAVEKLYLVVSDVEMLNIIHLFTPSIIFAACHRHGSFSIQALVEVVKSEECIQALSNALASDTKQLSLHPSGHFVLLRFLQRFHYPQIRFIVQCVCENMLDICTDHHGLRIVKALLKTCNDLTVMQPVFDEITRLTTTLVVDQYGNYAVQACLEASPESVCTAIRKNMQGHYLEFSKQKFSSNVVERSLRQSSPSWRSVIISELTVQPDVGGVLRDRFGNYTLQTALSVADAQQVSLLSESIGKHLSSLRDKVRVKWEMLLHKAKTKKK